MRIHGQTAGDAWCRISDTGQPSKMPQRQRRWSTTGSQASPTANATKRRKTMKSWLSYHPKEILCPVDMSDLSDLALKYAYAGALLFNAPLTVLHAMHVEVPRYLSRELTSQVLKELEDAKAAGSQALEDHVHRVIGDAGGDKTRLRYRVADVEPVAAVMQALNETHAELIVMGTHGYGGVKHWMLGSVTESILHRSPVPVFTVRQKISDFIDTTQPETGPRIHRILCPCNLNSAAGRALQVAAALADRFQARLTVLRSLESDSQADDVEKVREWVRQTIERDQGIDIIIQRGAAAAQAIRLADAQSCDLMVIGAHHHPFENGMVMGRTTELILRHASVPVLAVPTFDEDR
jgi:nucleotide-binding universal stress UspA family protein